MKYFVFACIVFATFNLTVSFAQPCRDVIMTMNSDTEEQFFKFRNQIPLDDEKWQLALALDAATVKKLIVIFLIANVTELCTQKGDSIDFTFTSGHTLFLKNILDDNCDKKFAVTLDLASGTNNIILDSLGNHDLASITVHNNGKKIKGDFRNNRKPLFRSALQCLRDVLTSETAATSLKEAESSVVFMVVEQSPEFIGGYNGLKKFLGNNLKKQRDQGTVYVSFIVEKDGSLSDLKVLRGISPKADAEALRVMKLMPNWSPGIQQGKPVRVRFNLPIKFG